MPSPSRESFNRKRRWVVYSEPLYYGRAAPRNLRRLNKRGSTTLIPPSPKSIFVRWNANVQFLLWILFSSKSRGKNFTNQILAKRRANLRVLSARINESSPVFHRHVGYCVLLSVPINQKVAAISIRFDREIENASHAKSGTYLLLDIPIHMRLCACTAVYICARAHADNSYFIQRYIWYAPTILPFCDRVTLDFNNTCHAFYMRLKRLPYLSCLEDWQVEQLRNLYIYLLYIWEKMPLVILKRSVLYI